MVQNYILAKDIKEVLQLLSRYQGQSRIMAGGTDLVLDLQNEKYQADYLIDITRIPELKEIRKDGHTLTVGAAVTHNQAAQSPLIQQYAHALAKASHCVGSHQIRNCSTIGGNIVNAQPAADSAVALAALGAAAKIEQPDQTQVLTMDRLYAGFGKSTVDSTQSLLTYIQIPGAGPGEGSGYARLEQRKALALPMVCAAAFLSLKENTIQYCRIAMAPVGIGPVRAQQAEAFLMGKEPSEENFEQAGILALKNAVFRDSLVRGSRHYREEVLPVIVARALSEAYSDAVTPKEEVTLQ